MKKSLLFIISAFAPFIYGQNNNTANISIQEYLQQERDKASAESEALKMIMLEIVNSTLMNATHPNFKPIYCSHITQQLIAITIENASLTIRKELLDNICDCMNSTEDGMDQEKISHCLQNINSLMQQIYTKPEDAFDKEIAEKEFIKIKEQIYSHIQ